MNALRRASYKWLDSSQNCQGHQNQESSKKCHSQEEPKEAGGLNIMWCCGGRGDPGREKTKEIWMKHHTLMVAHLWQMYHANANVDNSRNQGRRVHVNSVLFSQFSANLKPFWKIKAIGNKVTSSSELPFPLRSPGTFGTSLYHGTEHVCACLSPPIQSSDPAFIWQKENCILWDCFGDNSLC